MVWQLHRVWIRKNGVNMKINDNGIEREMTETEQTEHLAWAKLSEIEDKDLAKAKKDKAIARQDVLDRLGITADEATLLLG